MCSIRLCDVSPSMLRNLLLKFLAEENFVAFDYFLQLYSLFSITFETKVILLSS